MTPQRSVRVDVGSDITIPIKSALSIIIARDPLGQDVVLEKGIELTIDYLKPETESYGSNYYAGSVYTVMGLGPRGYSGSAGLPGNNGAVGFTGSAGSEGPRGFTGSFGSLGYSGSVGNTGLIGQPGPPGINGVAGGTGYSGSHGSTGFSGSAGIQGPTGFVGSRGNAGFTGSRGSTGGLGETGYVGSATVSYRTFRVNGQTAVTANVPNDTFNLVSGSGISLTTTSSSIRITNTTTIPGANTQILRSNGANGVVSNNNITFNGQALAVFGNITATGDVISSFSDDRLKIRQGNITDAVNKLNSLNGFYFNYNSLANDLGYFSDKTHIGVSAQEVQQVLPEIVESAPIHPDYLTVNYDRLVPVLVEALKAQTLEIAELEEKLQTLFIKFNKSRGTL